MELCKCGCGQEAKDVNDYIHGHNRRGKVSYTSNGRWAVNYDCCSECGTTEIAHNSHGLCKRCYRRKLYLLKKEKEGRWSKLYVKCTGCGKIDRPHKAKGLCDRCYSNETNRNHGKKKRNFGAWSWYYDECKKCGTTDVEHAANGLCKNCYDQEKRNVASCVPCPVCNVMVNKLNQHLTMKAKKCDKHYEYQKEMFSKYFESDLNLKDISDELGGMDRHAVTRQFVRFFGKEETKIRNEKVRRCNISEKAVINFNCKNRFGTVVEYSSPNQGLTKFRSKLEAEYAEYLDEVGTDWLYESKSFPYLDELGTRRTYTPDFYLPSEDKFVEIKGYEDDSAEYKVECVKAIGINIEMIRQKEVKRLTNEIKNLSKRNSI